jgi:hypothetical protein
LKISIPLNSSWISFGVFLSTRRSQKRQKDSEGLELALAGAGIGLLCALPLARAVSHLLYGVSANDLRIFFRVTLALVRSRAVGPLVPGATGDAG